jgi:hypothetical protein
VLTDDEIFALGRRSEPTDCVVAAGGVLGMRPLLIHSSPKAQTEAFRRVLHFEYARSLDLGCGVHLAVA